METDKHYFIEGLFIIGFSIAAALFVLWLVTSGHRDDGSSHRSTAPDAAVMRRA